MRYAVLVPDPTNPYDPNAVAVYIDGLHVGYECGVSVCATGNATTISATSGSTG